jgi:hypothetical protein
MNNYFKTLQGYLVSLLQMVIVYNLQPLKQPTIVNQHLKNMQRIINQSSL